MKKLPSLEKVKSLLKYDQDTGQFTWLVNRGRLRAGAPAGTMSDGYIQIVISHTSIKAHRIAWLMMTGKWPDMNIDHIDRNRSNNAWSNLRLTSQSGNAINSKTHSTNTSGARGVCWDAQRNKWKSRVRCNGRQVHCGFYDTVEEAGEAYQKNVRKLFGDFAP